ncbi:hypothetical protein CLV35_1239 [Motilibacter peucedani]|uniref:Uncharacterized protein n=1 Tax=Motilibacter peucedani TaxID=598650 RepID=A0A420XRT9_9ACTN|nr:hypothetical protein [Motilibacter peucedani]RKS77550.1 hypothetical protein CLV35_1239 [Motilibacter peucedani]
MPAPDRSPAPEQVAARLLELAVVRSRASTVELAALSALLDLVVADPLRSAVGLDELAERVVELYWAQVQPLADGRALPQAGGTSRQPALVEEVAALASAGRLAGTRTARATGAAHPARWSAAVRRVALLLAQSALPHLQSPGPDLLFESGWLHRRTTQAELDERGRALELLPGTPRQLALAAPLLRPALQSEWAAVVADAAGASPTGLGRLLFGLPPSAQQLREALLEAQDGRCLLCGGRARDAVVDTVVPWRRLPLDAAANLLVADARCSRERAGALLALPLVFRWSRRPAPALEEPDDSERVRRAMVGAYRSAPAGSPLWRARGSWEVAGGQEGERIAALFGA